jgi:hypothetical protein
MIPWRALKIAVTEPSGARYQSLPPILKTFPSLSARAAAATVAPGLIPCSA